MRKIIAIIVIVLNFSSAYGQKEKPENLPKFDARKYHFGFMLSFNSATFYNKYVNNYSYSDSIVNILLDRQPGFNLNIVGSWNPTPHINFRFTPGLSFEERQFTFSVYDNDTLNTTYLKKIESTYLLFPFYLKLRTARINNFAAYAIGGAFYGLDMANNKDLENNGALTQLTIQTTRSDWGYSAGGGFDFFLQYFKFGIELKFNVGMKNVLKQDNTFFAAPFESIRTGSWVFSLTFEG
ncbi:MAG TPA: outer membrane beta-barrel protein [Flavobacteriales bacterium]|nr:outer membrane beta-barrel protein [Flavobacteriales bacterium]